MQSSSYLTGWLWSPDGPDYDAFCSQRVNPCGHWCLTCPPSLCLLPPLSLFLYSPPPPLSILVPSPSPSSPPSLLHILSNVDGQGHSQKGFSPAHRGFFGSALGHSEGDAQTCRWAGSREEQRKSERPQLCDEQGIRGSEGLLCCLTDLGLPLRPP